MKRCVGCGKATAVNPCENCAEEEANHDPSLDPHNWPADGPEYSMSQRESDWVDYGGEDLIYPEG